MRKALRHSQLVTVAALAAAAALIPGTAAAARPAAGAGTGPPGTAAAAGKWTKISTSTGIAGSAGLLRTADDKLHVVWARSDGGTFSLHYSTVGAHAKLLATGTVVQKWAGVSATPRLVPGPGGGIRLVFTGGNGQNGSPFNLSAMYTATSSAAGKSWTLVHGALSQSTLIPLTDTAAVTESNGTPVAAWSEGALNLGYHVGIDPAIPAGSPDQTVTVNPGPAEGPVLARDSKGSIWGAWFVESGQSDMGYWVDRILPSQQAKMKAPGSGGKTLANNHPLQVVAFTARAGGGLYLAYCVPTKTVQCAHVALWRAGAAKAMTVPGSATQHAQHLAIAAAPGGHLWVLWYDSGLNKIRVVRTNAAATRFGPVQTIAGPPKLAEIEALQAEASRGPVDAVALAMQNTSGLPSAYFDTQLLAKLRMTGSPAKVSHTRATTVTFKVTDVGDAVSGAKVTFLGKTVTTNGKGIAKITVPKGTKTGKHKATARKAGYIAASFTVKVT